MKNFSALISIILVFSLLGPQAARADTFAGGDGSSNSPFQITTCGQLQAAGNGLTAHYILNNNVDCSATATSNPGSPSYDNSLYHNGEGFAPIGTAGNGGFKGTFDGRGHTISNLYIHQTAPTYLGLFGLIAAEGVVHNVMLIMTITGGDNERVGAIAGGNMGTIRDSLVIGGVTGGNTTYVGGLVGDNQGFVTNSFTNMVVQGGISTAVGGLAGHNSGTISNSYSVGSVSGGVGAKIGGFIGANEGSLSNDSWHTVVTYAIGSESENDNDPLARLADAGYGTDIDNPVDLFSTGAAVYNQGEEGGWDFVNTWLTHEGEFAYPTLRPLANLHDLFPADENSDGSSEHPWLITSCEELQNIGHDETTLAGYFKIADDVSVGTIDCSETSGWNGDEGEPEVFAGFDPIGTEDNPFVGSFDGNGKTITDLFINRPDVWHVGLFGVVGDSGHLANLTLESANITGEQRVGSLVGFNRGTIDNVSASATTVAGGGDIGGVVGKNGMDGEAGVGTISNSHASGSVSGNAPVGGFVGANSGIIEKSYVEDMTVVAIEGSAGGFLGWSDDVSQISESYAHATVTGVDTVGGFAGYNGGEITNAHARGSVTASGSHVGGFAGWSEGTIGVSYAVVNVEATGETEEEDVLQNVGGFIGVNNGTLDSVYSAGTIISVTEDYVQVGGFLGYQGGSVEDSGWWAGAWESAGEELSFCTENRNDFKNKDLAFYQNGWDFDGDPATWDIAGGDYPRLNAGWPYLFALGDSYASEPEDDGNPIGGNCGGDGDDGGGDSGEPTLVAEPDVFFVVAGDTLTVPAGAILANDEIEDGLENEVAVEFSDDGDGICMGEGPFCLQLGELLESNPDGSFTYHANSWGTDYIAYRIVHDDTSSDYALIKILVLNMDDGQFIHLDTEDSQLNDNTLTISPDAGQGITINKFSDDNLKASVYLPPGTTLTGGGDWDGALRASLLDEGEVALEIGFGDISIAIDPPVRILFPGQKGKQVGWRQVEDDELNLIEDVCDDADNPTLVPGEVCKIDVGASDLAVWTTHFTTFIVLGGTPPIVPPQNPSGGVRSVSGGSSVVGRVQNLLGTGNTEAAVALMLEYPSFFPAQSAPDLSAPLGAFLVRDLHLGMTGDDVRALQILLNTHGFPLASSGVGSMGSETNFFGALTRAALARYQAAHGITPTAGYFGPATRAQMKTAGLLGLWW